MFTPFLHQATHSSWHGVWKSWDGWNSLEWLETSTSSDDPDRRYSTMHPGEREWFTDRLWSNGQKIDPRPRRDHGNGGTIYVFFTITTGHNSPITYWLIAVHSFSTSWSSWKTINKQLILGPWDDKKLSLVLSRQNMVGTPILSPYRNIVINPIVGVNIPGSQTTLTLPETIWN